MKETKEEYCILDNEGFYLTSTSEVGSGHYIALYTKDNAKLTIDMFYKNKGYSIRKLKIK